MRSSVSREQKAVARESRETTRTRREESHAEAAEGAEHAEKTKSRSGLKPATRPGRTPTANT